MFFLQSGEKTEEADRKETWSWTSTGNSLSLHNFTNYLSAGFSFTADLKGGSFLCETGAASIVKNILRSKRNLSSNRATRCFVLGQFSTLNLRPLEAN